MPCNAASARVATTPGVPGRPRASSVLSVRNWQQPPARRAQRYAHRHLLRRDAARASAGSRD
jgi:hypothetical protein